jgi:hypothetical protein
MFDTLESIKFLRELEEQFNKSIKYRFDVDRGFKCSFVRVDNVWYCCCYFEGKFHEGSFTHKDTEVTNEVLKLGLTELARSILHGTV